MSNKHTAQIDVLAYAPHPDDAELFCGGLLAKLARQYGYRTAVVDLSRGELSTQGTLEIRAAEAAQAAEILGLSHRENLELPDGGIGRPQEGGNASRVEDSQLGRVVLSLRRLRPEVVLAPYHADRHPDHNGASRLVTEAVFFSGLAKFLPETAPFKPRALFYYQLRFAFRPSFVVDISQVYDAKLAAIRCFRSQIERSAEHASPLPTLVSSALSVSSISARDEYYGAMAGVRFAEPYFVRAPVLLDDPVALWRSLGAGEPLMYPAEE